MIDTTLDTHPLTAFHDNPGEILNQLRTARWPITLTVDGMPEAIFQEAAEYERLLVIAAQFGEDEAIRQGLEDIAAGRTRPAREVFAELNQKYGIRGYCREMIIQLTQAF